MASLGQQAETTLTVPSAMPEAAPAANTDTEEETAAESDLQSTPMVVMSPTPEVKTVQLWIPPQFDPAQNTEIGKFLSNFIKQFMSENPEVNIVLRIKATEGESSALNTLSAAKNAAPDVIPSLILLTRSDMETAVQRGLIQPITTELFTDAATWYRYALQAAVIDNTVYGIPIAGDGLVLTYRTSKIGAELGDWQDILTRGMPIAFVPASSTALFPTFVYKALGGKTTDDQGQIYLDQTKLTDTLKFFLDGGQKGVFPPSIAQVQDQAQNWQLFNDGTVNLIVSQFSTFRHYENSEINAIALPLFSNSESYPLTSTWNLVLTEDQPELQRIALRLAERFADPLINDELTLAAGYFPVRNTEHKSWENDNQLQTMQTINEASALILNNSTMSKIPAIINNAVLQVVKNAVTPEAAAQEAVTDLLSGSGSR